MSKLYTLLPVFLFSIMCYGQLEHNPHRYASTKLGLSLYKHLQQSEYAHSNELKNIMVKGDPGIVKALVAQYNGVYRYAAGDISSIAIPYKNLTAFSQSKGIERIEAYDNPGRGRSFMDTARIRNNIDSIQAGYAPLPQAYTGSGVLVGIIDGGIYFRHKDFRRANGNTRCLYIWDQADTTAGRPQPYNYGSEWDSTSINNGTCGHKEPASDNGHGTNVAGIAAGNGLSWATGDANLQKRYVGTAPDADMIVVSVDNSRPDFIQAVADAVNYIFTKASQLGRPCVINTSVGTYYGPHDGSELAVKAMETMLDQEKGRVIVAAAGNGGAVKHHLSYPLSPTDSLFTWFTYNSATHEVYFDLWADTAQFKTANFALGCDNTAGTFLGRTRYFNAFTDFNPAPDSTIMIDDSLFNGSTKLCNYTIAVTAYQGLYHVEFLAIPTLTTYLWRLQTLGHGTFDLWASKSLINTSSIATAYPSGFSSPNYRYGDSLKTIVSAWQCSDKVISVANYYSRAGYYDKDSNYVDLTIAPYLSTVGALASNSSLGPTRDGRMKPDIAATGDIVTSTGDSTYISQLTLSAQTYKISLGDKHTRNGGTSMASPIVAGIVALYLQEHPTATYNEVKTVIERTAKRDTFTSFVNIPNIQFGWGKINGFQALKYPVVYGCQDTGSVNYVAAANIDTGGCVPKVYGCTDTGSINYNALANTNNGSCIMKVYGITDSLCRNYDRAANVNSGTCIQVGIKEEAAVDLTLDVVPNPFTQSTAIYIYTQNPLSGIEIRFYDALGKTADVVQWPAGAKQIMYNNSRLSAGVYDLAVVRNNSIIAIKKVVVE